MAEGHTEVPAADAADVRLRRLRGAGAWGSLLSGQEFAAITSAGFDPVGHVLGTTVVHLGGTSQGGRCSGTRTYSSRTDLASGMSGPFNAMLRQRNGVRRLVVSRAVEECVALGGDGILGLSLNIRSFPAGGTEFTVQGTAVRARSTIRLASPFTSQVSGQEFARLVRGGWIPVALVFAVSLGARHDDRRTREQTRWTAASREVRGYSELAKDTRREARDQLAQAVTAQGADGLVAGEMTLHISERECPTVEGGHDHWAEATVLGTSIVSFNRSPRGESRAPLVVMGVGSSPVVPAGLSPVSFPESRESAVAQAGLLDRYLTARADRRASRSTVSSSDPTYRSRRTDSE